MKKQTNLSFIIWEDASCHQKGTELCLTAPSYFSIDEIINGIQNCSKSIIAVRKRLYGLQEDYYIVDFEKAQVERTKKWGLIIRIEQAYFEYASDEDIDEFKKFWKEESDYEYYELRYKYNS